MRVLTYNQRIHYVEWVRFVFLNDVTDEFFEPKVVTILGYIDDYKKEYQE